ncbi:ribosome maturation factor RimP [Arthrobacter monumenti]
MVRPNHNPGDAEQTRAESHRLRELLEPTVSAHDLYLEDVQVKSAGTERTVSVVVDLHEDRTGGVSLDTISDVSSELSRLLDEDPHDTERPYQLEVSSPGAARPLTEPRHWRRARGRLVNMAMVDGGEVTGRLLDVDDDGVTVRPQVQVKKGMKPKKGEPTHFAFEQVRKGAVEIEFSRVDEDLDGGTAGNHTFSAEEA